MIHALGMFLDFRKRKKSFFALSESLETSRVHGLRNPARKTIRYSFNDDNEFNGKNCRLLRYLKKNENRYRKKNTDNTDISVFFRNCILLNFMQNLLNLMQNFLFSNDAKQTRYNSFDSSGA